MKEVPLNHGKVALVDDADFPAVSQLRWIARKTANSNIWYAHTTTKPILLLHHFLLGKPPKGFVIDHVNGDGLMNTRANLRVCTQKENMKNQRQHRDSKSPFKGIWRAQHCDRWAAQLVCNRKKIYLGLYKEPEDAARAYDRKAIELFGPFARLNFPQAAA